VQINLVLYLAKLYLS